jgi:hypothetical protein
MPAWFGLLLGRLDHGPGPFDRRPPDTQVPDDLVAGGPCPSATVAG